MKHIPIILILLVSGCINLRHDITDDEKGWFPYSMRNVYITREPLFLIKVDSGLEPERLALVPPSDHNRGSGLYSSPKSIELYKENPKEACRNDLGEEFRMKVIDILESGTEFVPLKIKRNSGWDVWFGNHTCDTRYGRIKSGKFTGSVVDIEDISWFMESGSTLNRYVEIK